MSLASDPYYRTLKETLTRIAREKGESFYGWRATVTLARSLQSLMLGDPQSGLRTYQEREVEEISYSVSVYARKGDPVTMGQTLLTLDRHRPLEEQILSAYENALLVENPPYDLPLPPAEPYREVETADPLLFDDMKGSEERLRSQASEAVRKLEGVLVNSAELYLNRSESHTESSTGIVMPRRDTDLYFEAAMEKLPLPNTQEVHRYIKGITVSEMDFSRFLESMKEETLSLDRTVLPATSDNATLLVEGEVVSDFLNAILGQLDASQEYLQSPHLKPGERMVSGETQEKSDPVNLTLDPFLPSMALSTPFTGEGLPAQSARVIENNEVKEQIVSSRIGHYLNRSPNGITGNMILEAGSTSKEELIASRPEVMEILSFSSLLINPRTLTWSSEIKLGRLYKNGKPVAMIKGGVASGEIKSNFASARFTAETMIRNAVADTWHPAIGYRGPRHMLIRSGVKIAGETP